MGAATKVSWYVDMMGVSANSTAPSAAAVDAAAADAADTAANAGSGGTAGMFASAVYPAGTPVKDRLKRAFSAGSSKQGKAVRAKAGSNLVCTSGTRCEPFM